MIRRPAKWDILSTRRRDNTNGLVGWWTFQDGTAMDWSGNQHNGALVASPPAISGIIGNALSFNGSTQYVNVGSLAAFELSIANYCTGMGKCCISFVCIFWHIF